MKIHHVGYLVSSINNAITEFKSLGFSMTSELIYDQTRNIDICFMENGSLCIELVQPISQTSLVFNLLKRYKNMPYHVCYESANLNEQIKILTNSGYVLIQEPQRAVAINNHKVAFLMNNDIGMIELVEINEEN